MYGHLNSPNGGFRDLLSGIQTVAVVGLSDDASRPSYGVAAALRSFGLRVIPVNPNLTSAVLGETPYPSLVEVPVHIDVVDVFRRSEEVMPIARQAVDTGADILWMQFGVVNEEAARHASDNGLTVVMDRCLKVEYGLAFRG